MDTEHGSITRQALDAAAMANAGREHDQRINPADLYRLDDMNEDDAIARIDEVFGEALLD